MICKHFRDDALMYKQHCYLCLMFHFLFGLFFEFGLDGVTCVCVFASALALEATHFKYISFTAFHLTGLNRRVKRIDISNGLRM